MLNKKLLIIVSFVGLLLLSLTSVVLADAKDEFSDLDESNPYYADINLLYEQDIINGYPDGTFRPDNDLRRVEVAIMIHRALGQPDGDVGAMTFTDVPDYAKEAVASLAEQGIIHGFSETRFGPNEIANRAQVAKFLVTAFDINTDVPDQGFTDINDDPMLSEYVNALGASGIAAGYPNGEFGVLDNVIRKHFASLLVNAMNDEDSPNPEVIGIE